MRRLQQIAIALLFVFLAAQAALSLQWPIAHDEAPLFYEAFLMRAEGLVPYRDLFDFQMPGSFIAYFILGLLSGFDDLRIRILDLVILAVLSIITYFTMRRFGKTSALAAPILFGLEYLQGGPSMSLQREYLLLVFLALAVWVSMRGITTLKQRITLGLLFGLAAVIKPHAAIGLIPILLFDIADISKRSNISLPRSAWTSLLPAALGFAVPILAVIAWLAFTNALTPFISIAVNYWPLYSQINGAMELNTGTARWAFLFGQLPRLGGHWLWLIPALIGIYFHQHKQTWLLASLALCYAIYPAFSGQFFSYHFIPFTYFIILLASITVEFPLSSSMRSVHPSRLVFIFQLSSLILVLSLLLPSRTFIRQLQGKPVATSTDRAGEIARFLDANLQPGDTVQPLDWTGGTLLAMLESRSRIATPYVFDFYFYHHVSHPYIQSLRADFMTDLQSANPRFIVEVTAEDKPWVSGADSSRSFPGLRLYLNENYSVTIQKDGYVIYELNEDP